MNNYLTHVCSVKKERIGLSLSYGVRFECPFCDWKVDSSNNGIEVIVD